jgi:hypothetical protein
VIVISKDLTEAKELLRAILADREFGGNDFLPSSWQIPEEWIWAMVILLLVFSTVVVIARWYLTQKEKNQEGSGAKPIRYLFEAQNHAEKGDFRLAFRFLFLDLLALLRRKRKLSLDNSRTNGEYRQEIRKTWPEEAHSFAEISLRFDEVWYGQKSATSEEYQRYYAWYQKVKQNEDK